MRIAVLADIHANAWALEAVLADVRKHGCAAVWNLGDILHGAPVLPGTTNMIFLARTFLKVQKFFCS